MSIGPVRFPFHSLLGIVQGSFEVRAMFTQHVREAVVDTNILRSDMNTLFSLVKVSGHQVSRTAVRLWGRGGA